MNGSSGTATYRGRGGTLLRTGGCTVLLGVEPGHPLVDLCWAALQTSADVDDVLETIVAQGLRTAPAFAVVREQGVRRVVARGALTLALDGQDVLADRHPGAWVDLPLADASAVEVALTSPLVGPSLPLRDGVAAAAGFHLALERPGPVPAHADTHGLDQDVDHLLAETRVVRPAREGSDQTSRPGDPHGPTAASEETLPTTFTSGLAGSSEAARAGRDVVAGRQPLGRGADSIDVPHVLAAVCPSGHLTPAYSGVCRVCRRVVATQEAFETARPVLGRLVLPQGDPVLLDRGAVLGRAPHVPADWAGPQPHLVTLPDPEQDVSAQHASVVLDLWNVLVSDLGSTNGTTLVDQDGRVTVLRPYEPVRIGPGATIVVAEVVTLRFEVSP